MELLYYKDEDAPEINDDNILKLITISNNQTRTSSMAIYRISPVVTVRHNKEHFVYPKVKVYTDEDLKGEKKVDPHEDLHVIRNKFDVKQNVFGKEAELKEKPESNFVDVIDPEYNPEPHEDFQIKKPEDEEGQRKHLDNFNLLRGFQFAFDPYCNRSELIAEEDLIDTQVNFDSVDKRVENIFGIGLN